MTSLYRSDWRLGLASLGIVLACSALAGLYRLITNWKDRSMISKGSPKADSNEPEITFAWCFSHGRMHVFRPSTEYPDGAWCTATWAPLAAKTEHEALAEKIHRFGENPFRDDAAHHVQICELRDAWKAEQEATR